MLPVTKTYKKGFTIIELLVVVAIIAVLSGVILSNLSTSKARNRDTRRISDIKSIQLSLEIFYNDNGFYPADPYNTYNAADGVTYADGLEGAYMPRVPRDPGGTQVDKYKYTGFNSGGTSNCAAAATPPIRYHLAGVMEFLTSDNSSALREDVGYNPGGASGCSTSPTPTPFHGDATNCSGLSVATPDRCYDVTN